MVLQNTNAPFPIQHELGLSQNKHTHVQKKRKSLKPAEAHSFNQNEEKNLSTQNFK